jgi:hypothetical protein
MRVDAGGKMPSCFSIGDNEFLVITNESLIGLNSLKIVSMFFTLFPHLARIDLSPCPLASLFYVRSILFESICVFSDPRETSPNLPTKINKVEYIHFM